MEYKKGRSSFLRCIVGHLFIFLRIYTRMEGEQHWLTMERLPPDFRFFPTDEDLITCVTSLPLKRMVSRNQDHYRVQLPDYYKLRFEFKYRV
jgi:hypothetical protein